MYYQSYEDYIRSILGYPVIQNSYTDTYVNEYMNQMPMYSSEIMDLYPEIYKIINPMVCKICDANTKPITKELIDVMTDEIYMSLESDPFIVDTINVKVNLPKEEKNEDNEEVNFTQYKNNTNSNPISTTSTGISNRSKEAKIDRSIKQDKTRSSLKKQLEIVENSNNYSKNIMTMNNREYRQTRRNSTLQDLIRIMILNQLLWGNRRPQRPFHPPFPEKPIQNPRPPFQSGRFKYKTTN